MEWIVKIETSEEERKQRIRVVFNPMAESIHVYGEAKIINGERIRINTENKIRVGEWTVFSEYIYNMVIDLDELQEVMGKAVVAMRTRLKEYENLSAGFKVLKWIGYEKD